MTQPARPRGSSRVWCIQHRDGWCASFRGHEPSESAMRDKTACGMFVLLRLGSEKRVPTCRHCKARVARRRSA